MNSALYEDDYYLWLEKTAQLLRKGKLSELDIPNLAEEIEDMGRSERRAVKSNLIVILMHLLQYTYQPDKRSSSWLNSITEHRTRVELVLEDSPSLKPYLEEVFPACYHKARRDAAIETGLPCDVFPLESPFSVEEALSPNWLPD